MGYPWNETAEAFILSQLRQTVNFWRLGRFASYSLEAMSDGNASLVTKFQLPQPSEHLPPLRPNSSVNPFLPKTQPQQNPGNQVLIPSKTPGIPPLFPFGPPKPSRQVARRPIPSLKSTSQRRRDYVRAMLHRAQISVPVKPVLPGTLRALAKAALPQPTTNKSHLPSSQVTSTPNCPPKRKRSSSQG